MLSRVTAQYSVIMGWLGTKVTEPWFAGSGNADLLHW
jgi:hypothetical protein